MKITYITKKGSVYIHRTDASAGGWFKQDEDGLLQPLAGAIHLPRTRLQELLREYPTSVLDTTVCFGSGLAREFFEDAEREHNVEIPDGRETNIFFLISKGQDKYAIGYSSSIERIEKSTESKMTQTTV